MAVLAAQQARDVAVSRNIGDVATALLQSSVLRADASARENSSVPVLDAFLRPEKFSEMNPYAQTRPPSYLRMKDMLFYSTTFSSSATQEEVQNTANAVAELEAYFEPLGPNNSTLHKFLHDLDVHALAGQMTNEGSITELVGVLRYLGAAPDDVGWESAVHLAAAIFIEDFSKLIHKGNRGLRHEIMKIGKYHGVHSKRQKFTDSASRAVDALQELRDREADADADAEEALAGGAATDTTTPTDRAGWDDFVKEFSAEFFQELCDLVGEEGDSYRKILRPLSLPTIDKYAKQLARLLLFVGRSLTHLHDPDWGETQAALEELGLAVEALREDALRNYERPPSKPTSRNIDSLLVQRVVRAVNFQLLRCFNLLVDVKDDHSFNKRVLNQPRCLADAFVRGSALDVSGSDALFVAQSPTYVRRASAALQFCVRLSYFGTMVHAALSNNPFLQSAFNDPGRLTTSPAMMALGNISTVCRKVETILHDSGNNHLEGLSHGKFGDWVGPRRCELRHPEVTNVWKHR